MTQRGTTQHNTTHAKRTVVPQAPVSADFLEALEVLTQLHVEGVGNGLAELAIFGILLTVKHPIRDLELARILHDRHKPFNFLGGQLASPATNRKVYITENLNSKHVH